MSAGPGRRAAHRLPPLPHWQAERGRCRWCGEPVLRPDGQPNRRRLWHDPCLAAYKLAAWPKEQRRALLKRDRGRCAGCGADCRPSVPEPRPGRRVTAPEPLTGGRIPYTKLRWGKRPLLPWHADHVVPLFSVDPAAPDALRYWTLENLQTLCETCHKAKCAAEAAGRAGARRAGRQS
ncbi:MAG TPA: hypothetical protein VEH84_01150 [Alphaproteobacteria bacterium]|nr:hypothetical protein [Alphaproteobacteria bacterium]